MYITKCLYTVITINLCILSIYPVLGIITRHSMLTKQHSDAHKGATFLNPHMLQYVSAKSHDLWPRHASNGPLVYPLFKMFTNEVKQHMEKHNAP